MAAKRVRAARKKGRRHLGGVRPWTRGSQLQRYLLDLQDTYRPAHQPFPTSPEQNEEEAQGIFNADHALGIVLSIPGPWFKQADVERWGMPPRITRVLNQIRRFREEAAQTRAVRGKWTDHNRRIGIIKAQIKRVGFFPGPERQQILDILDTQQVRLRPAALTSPGLGITVGPDVAASKHAHWTPRANHLLSYLGRTAPGTTELERCAAVATILHFASEGRFPRGARGAALVKQRSYRSL
jgi:hypothetical protein